MGTDSRKVEPNEAIGKRQKGFRLQYLKSMHTVCMSVKHYQAISGCKQYVSAWSMDARAAVQRYGRMRWFMDTYISACMHVKMTSCL